MRDIKKFEIIQSIWFELIRSSEAETKINRLWLNINSKFANPAIRPSHLLTLHCHSSTGLELMCVFNSLIIQQVRDY